MIDQFDKGGSIPRTVTLVDDNSDAIDTTIFTTIEVRIFSWLHRVIGTYSLAAGTVARIAPNVNGQIFFVVPSATTAISRAIKYFYRVRTTEVDVAFPTGIRTRSFTGWGFELKMTK